MKLPSKEFIEKRQRKSFIKAVVSLYNKKEITMHHYKELLKDIDREEIERIKNKMKKQTTKEIRDLKKTNTKIKLQPQKAVKKVIEKRKKEKTKKKKNIDDWI